MMGNIYEYPDEDADIDGIANLWADIKTDRRKGASHLSLNLNMSGMVTGARAASAFANQSRLHADRAAHREAVCWNCPSTDVGYDFQRGRWSCITCQRL